jgi:hypothetical protein
VKIERLSRLIATTSRFFSSSCLTAPHRCPKTHAPLHRWIKAASEGRNSGDHANNASICNAPSPANGSAGCSRDGRSCFRPNYCDHASRCHPNTKLLPPCLTLFRPLLQAVCLSISMGLRVCWKSLLLSSAELLIHCSGLRSGELAPRKQAHKSE